MIRRISKNVIFIFLKCGYSKLICWKLTWITSSNFELSQRPFLLTLFEDENHEKFFVLWSFIHIGPYSNWEVIVWTIEDGMYNFNWSIYNHTKFFNGFWNVKNILNGFLKLLLQLFSFNNLKILYQKWPWSFIQFNIHLLSKFLLDGKLSKTTFLSDQQSSSDHI